MPANSTGHITPAAFPSLAQFRERSEGGQIRSTLQTLLRLLTAHTAPESQTFCTEAESLLEQLCSSPDDWARLQATWQKKCRGRKDLAPWQWIMASAVLVVADCFHRHIPAAALVNTTAEQLLAAADATLPAGNRNSGSSHRSWLEGALRAIVCTPPTREAFISNAEHFRWLQETVAFTLFSRRFHADLADDNRFSSCFSFLVDRCLTTEAWPLVISAYREALFLGSPATFDSFFRTRLELLTYDWQRGQSGNLHSVAAQHVENIEEVSIDRTTLDEDATDEDDSALASLLRRNLQPESRACLLLRLWPRLSPLQQRRYWPDVVTGASGIHASQKRPKLKQPFSETELGQRLHEKVNPDTVFSKDADEQFRRQEAQLAVLAAHEQAADLRKRQAVGRRIEAAVSNQLRKCGFASPSFAAQIRQDSRQQVLSDCRDDCEHAVRKGSVASIRRDFDPSQILSQQRPGRQEIINRDLWNRRDFCVACHRQKYYRRRRLNRTADLQRLRDTECLSDTDIAEVLQCPQGTVESHLNRFRAWALVQPETASRRDTVSRIEHESGDEARLDAWVCGQLEPPAR